MSNQVGDVLSLARSGGNLRRLRVSELSDVLDHLGLSTDGSKDILISRIQEYCSKEVVDKDESAYNNSTTVDVDVDGSSSNVGGNEGISNNVDENEGNSSNVDGNDDSNGKVGGNDYIISSNVDRNGDGDGNGNGGGGGGNVDSGINNGSEKNNNSKEMKKNGSSIKTKNLKKYSGISPNSVLVGGVGITDSNLVASRSAKFGASLTFGAKDAAATSNEKTSSLNVNNTTNNGINCLSESKGNEIRDESIGVNFVEAITKDLDSLIRENKNMFMVSNVVRHRNNNYKSRKHRPVGSGNENRNIGKKNELNVGVKKEANTKLIVGGGTVKKVQKAIKKTQTATTLTTLKTLTSTTSGSGQIHSRNMKRDFGSISSETVLHTNSHKRNKTRNYRNRFRNKDSDKTIVEHNSGAEKRYNERKNGVKKHQRNLEQYSDISGSAGVTDDSTAAKRREKFGSVVATKE